MEIMTTWNTDFEFDLQRFAGLDGMTAGTYYLDGLTAAGTPIDLDDAGWTTTAPTVTSTKYCARVIINTSKEITSISVSTAAGDGTKTADQLEYGDYAGTVKESAALASALTINDASNVTLDLSAGNNDDVTVKSGFKAGDIVTLAAAKTLTIGTKGYVANSAGTKIQGGTVSGSLVHVLVAGDLTLTSVSSQDVTYGTASAAGTAATVTGTLNVSGTAVVAAAGNVTDFTNGAVITKLAAGKTVTNGTTAFNADQTVSVNGTTFTAGTANNAVGAFSVANVSDTISVIDGNVASPMSGTTYLATNATTANGRVVVGSGTGDGVQVSVATGVATVSDLEEGESFTVYDAAGTTYRTYTYVTSTVVKMSDNTGGSGYFTAQASYKINTVLSPAPTSQIDTGANDYATAGTYNFNEIGVVTSSGSVDTNAAATLVTNSGGSKTLTVRSATAGVTFANDTNAVTVTDNGTTTSYTASTNSTFTANGAKFTATKGVVSGVTGTLTLVDGKQIEALGTANVDASNVTTAATNMVIFKGGSNGAVSGAKITFNNGATMTLTESGNSDASATDTEISNTGAITGLEGTATIVLQNGADSTTIQTANSGTLTLNKATYTVTGDDDGVTFTTGTTAGSSNDRIVTVANLANDATLEVGKLSAEATFTVNTQAFNTVTASNGAVFTAESSTNTSIQLKAKNDTVTIGGVSYTVNAMGSASDYITISNDGHVYGLNDGDKLTVVGTAGTSVYEASSGILKVTRGTAVTTYTRSDSSSDSFTISNSAGTGLVGVVDNGTAGEAVTVTFGTNSGVTPTTSLTDGTYINADGSTALTSDKAVAQIGVTDTTITYQASSDKGQTVQVTADSANKEDWNITTRAGKDAITFTGGTANATIDSGAGADTIIVSGSGEKIVTAGDGADTITIQALNSGDATINAGAGKDVITVNGTGDYVVNADSGDNFIDVSGAGRDVTVVGGTGKDTITAASADNTISGGSSADTFVVLATGGNSMKVSDYTYGEDKIQVVAAGTTSVVGANANIFGGDGVVTVGTGITADVSAGTGTGDFYAVTMVDGNGKNDLNVAWAKDGGSNIDISSYTKDVMMVGNADGTNALYGGTGSDTIYSYADNDSVFGGTGKDTISLAGNGTGRTVGVSTTMGKDSVSGFTTGFSDADSLFMVDGAASDVKASYDATKKQVMFKDGSGSLQLNAINAAATGAVELNVSGAKLAVLGSGVTANVESATYADIFYGDGSAVDFSKVDGDLNVNLANNLASSGDGAKYVGITSVVGGAGANTLMGSAKADSIVAGTGKSSLYGGAGADTLVGNGEADVFFLADGTNTNTVVGFQTADKETYDTVKILGNIAGAKLNGSNVELSTSDGSKAVVTGMNANSMIKIESDSFTGVAKLGDSSKDNSFTYDKSVSFYGGGSKTDKISVASGFSDNAEVWLDGSKGTAYASVDAVDFSNGSGNYVLAGDSSKNTIVGGKADNALWGGAGTSADSLKGGTGKNNFYYGLAEGNDSITSSSADDTVNLYNISLSDITGGEITSSGVWLSFTDGSKLTVATSKDIKFTMSDGSTYTAEHSSKSWK